MNQLNMMYFIVWLQDISNFSDTDTYVPVHMCVSTCMCFVICIWTWVHQLLLQACIEFRGCCETSSSTVSSSPSPSFSPSLPSSLSALRHRQALNSLLFLTRQAVQEVLWICSSFFLNAGAACTYSLASLLTRILWIHLESLCLHNKQFTLSVIVQAVLSFMTVFGLNTSFARFIPNYFIVWALL